MALIHRATLSPSKLELITAWLPGHSWFAGGASLEQLGAYRFDDPAGEVGIETFLFRTPDGAVVQVPVTYRGAPLPEAEQHLVGTTGHSVLGTRWVYDGCADPVYATALATAILTGGNEASEDVLTDGSLVPREPTARVVGSGRPGTPVPEIDAVRVKDEGPFTAIDGGDLEILLIREVGAEVTAAQMLTGSWASGGPAILAVLSWH